MTSAQSNSKGILSILMGMALFSIQDALIKFIYEDAALYELYFGRTFVAFILLVAYSIYKSKSRKDYRLIHNILKVLLLIGVFSLVFIDTSILIEKVINKTK